MEEKPNYFAVIPANVRYDTRLRANEKLLYGEITALTYKTGECWASNTYFSKLYETTPQAISRWILNLKKYGYVDIDYTYKGKEIEKRIIRVSTYIDRYQQKVEGGINKCLGGYQQKVEENNTSINNTSINNTYKQDFEELWKLYPNKKGKTDAYKKYVRAIKDGVTNEIIKDGIIRYKNFVETEHIKQKYIKHGSSWFNQECWKDDYTIDQESSVEDEYEKFWREKLNEEE